MIGYNMSMAARFISVVKSSKDPGSLQASTIGLIRDNAEFGGLPSEDSNQHLTNFLELCDTVKISGMSGDEIKRRLFPFSLRDHARSWLQSQSKDSFASWEDLVKVFSKKNFSPSKT